MAAKSPPNRLGFIDKRRQFLIILLWLRDFGAIPVNIVRKFAANTAVVSFVLAGAALVSFAPPANAVNYTTSGFSLTSLGDTIHSGYDWLTGTSETGTLSDPSTILLNTLSFTAGVNAYVPQYYPNLSITETISVNSGTPQQIQIPFTLNISYQDTLTIIGGSTFSFLDGSTLWQGVVNGVTLGPNAGGTQTGYLLTARMTDPLSTAPLPAAFPLFASGLGAMGLFAWWRKRKSGAASAA